MKSFVLKTVKYQEADLIVTLLSESKGKISCMARAALKSKKRFSGGVLEPTHFIQSQLKESSSGRLATLQEAKLIDPFPGLRADFDRLETALYVLDAIHKVAQEGDSSAIALFNLCGHSLKALQTVEDAKFFRLHFILRFLYDQGVLRQQEWMHEYLQFSIAKHAILAQQKPLDGVSTHLAEMDLELKIYLKTAGV